MAVRALVPVGFMLSLQADGPALVFCPAVMSAHATPEPGYSSGHHGPAEHHGAIEESPNGAPGDSPCPFALAGVAAPSGAVHIDVYVADSDVLLPKPRQPSFQAGPPRSERARGPPGISPAMIV